MYSLQFKGPKGAHNSDQPPLITPLISTHEPPSRGPESEKPRMRLPQGHGLAAGCPEKWAGTWDAWGAGFRVGVFRVLGV